MSLRDLGWCLAFLPIHLLIITMGAVFAVGCWLAAGGRRLLPARQLEADVRPRRRRGFGSPGSLRPRRRSHRTAAVGRRRCRRVIGARLSARLRSSAGSPAPAHGAALPAGRRGCPPR